MNAIFALNNYWRGFVDHWTGVLSRQTGFTMVIIGCGVVGVLIIMAGRKKLDS